MLYIFFFNDTATTEIYTLSLHDALPIYLRRRSGGGRVALRPVCRALAGHARRVACDRADRKSTRLNSSHLVISYAVFCLKKKKTAYASIKSLGGAQTPRVILIGCGAPQR